VSDQKVEDNTTRATARLPGLDIEIIHRRSLNDEAEQISINLQAMPSFEAFGRFLETVSPFAFCAQAVQMAWLPWFNAARFVMLPSPNITSMLPTLSSNKNQTASNESPFSGLDGAQTNKNNSLVPDLPRWGKRADPAQGRQPRSAAPAATLSASGNPSL
jgi:hypothetical protein